jgi:hypothetical protein
MQKFVDNSTRGVDKRDVINATCGPNILEAVKNENPKWTEEVCVEQLTSLKIVGKMVHATVKFIGSAAPPRALVPANQTFFSLAAQWHDGALSTDDALDQYSAMCGFLHAGAYRMYGACPAFRSEVLSRIGSNPISDSEWEQYTTFVATFIKERVAHYCDPGGRRCVQLTAPQLDVYLKEVFAARDEYFAKVQEAKANMTSDTNRMAMTGAISSCTIPGRNTNKSKLIASKMTIVVAGSAQLVEQLGLKVSLVPCIYKAGALLCQRRHTVTISAHDFVVGDSLYAIDNRRIKKNTDVGAQLAQNHSVSVVVIRKLHEVRKCAGMGFFLFNVNGSKKYFLLSITIKGAE